MFYVNALENCNKTRVLFLTLFFIEYLLEADH